MDQDVQLVSEIFWLKSSRVRQNAWRKATTRRNAQNATDSCKPILLRRITQTYSELEIIKCVCVFC